MIDADDAQMVRRSWYEASVRRGAEPPLFEGDEEADIGIVGAGYAGLSAAIELRKRGFSVAVLDARVPGYGASGRNGGQVLAGFAHDESVVAQLGATRARALWQMTVEAVELVRGRIAELGIDCDYVPGYLHAATSETKRGELFRWAETLKRDFGYDRLEPVGPDRIREWIDSPRYAGATFDPLGGHLHPLKYCLGLAAAAEAAGARLYAHSPVLMIERGGKPILRTERGRLACRHVLAACNAYLGDLLPQISRHLLPVRSFIVATETLNPGEADRLVRGRAAVSDNNFVLDYYRATPDDRLLFGGRVASISMGPEALAPVLAERMRQVFPQLGHYRIEHAWGGLIDLTLNRAPDFGRIDDNIYYLQGFSGHGLALAGLAGKLVAEAIAGEAGRFELFTGIRHHDVPGGRALHGILLRLGILYYRLRELL